jgi:hypothetical protein
MIEEKQKYSENPKKEKFGEKKQEEKKMGKK